MKTSFYSLILGTQKEAQMKRWTLLFLAIVASLQSCGYKEKEVQLTKREQRIAEKELSLMQWEQRLALWEKDLQEKEKKQHQDFDTATDSLNVQPLTGKWIVRMRCTETNCDGSAIGDSKTETWEIAYLNNGIVINAFAGNKLSRIYNGTFRETRLEATNGQPDSESVIRVTLEMNGNKMEGTREVERANCKILYTLTAEKQK
ncbi:hypothetical protein J2Y45_006677 [Dyadobacter sp. BE34]|uniref:Lipocalin-like domain-containing protein n=1 Tax=Dyadobacter fermentans TaxID=94254 RepID=A0ABU1R866_9BACT|nr:MULTISPECIES: hypothetical protein [Dyadobacter]MDR6809599.1 hypothetical protein [Dyadobacter fermentans]MDR7047277.1 hypothetical protein [Dyadobacter sp. BE242]MDR7201513.1 hypothetical protein [Dyadobacter sp. BE34]MDR7219383.1 hypothetical protein [Dyadobacter sp. BE31]MDR7267223.1 hypothetical protein [Dyadobacter sp. BE32]